MNIQELMKKIYPSLRIEPSHEKWDEFVSMCGDLPLACRHVKKSKAFEFWLGTGPSASTTGMKHIGGVRALRQLEESGLPVVTQRVDGRKSIRIPEVLLYHKVDVWMKTRMQKRMDAIIEFFVDNVIRSINPNKSESNKASAKRYGCRTRKQIGD